MLHPFSNDTSIFRYQSNIEFVLWWALASKLTFQFSAKANTLELLNIFFRVDWIRAEGSNSSLVFNLSGPCAARATAYGKNSVSKIFAFSYGFLTGI